MSRNLVTVVLPTYNRPGFLREALTSVRAQDFEQFDVLIADDGSSYDVASLVESFQDPRLSLRRHKRNSGYIQNSHWALCAAKTRYVAMLEDDCLWHPDHLSRAITALERWPTAPFYCCATETFGAGTNGMHKPHWSQAETIELCDWRETGFGVWLVWGVPMSVSSVVVRREALNGLFWGGKTWPFCQDYLWWGQLALKDAFIYDPSVGARYRWHESNVTHTNLDATHRARSLAQWRFTQRLLASRAYALGGLRDLAAETRDFPPGPLSVLLVALAAPETPEGLARQAHAIAEARSELAEHPDSATLYRLAARLGGWALSYADVAGRLRGHWWPIPAL